MNTRTEAQTDSEHPPAEAFADLLRRMRTGIEDGLDPMGAANRAADPDNPDDHRHQDHDHHGHGKGHTLNLRGMQVYVLGHAELPGQAVPLASLRRPSTISPWRFSISRWPIKQSLASLPLPLRYSFASPSVTFFSSAGMPDSVIAQYDTYKRTPMGSRPLEGPDTDLGADLLERGQRRLLRPVRESTGPEVVVLVEVLLLAGPARRMDAGRASECCDLQA